jgi:AAA+ ATPase superfamily predicted ATPase
MKFINRKEELQQLEQLYHFSQKRLTTTVISGPRRVGKTELIKQFVKDRPYLYFFIHEGRTVGRLLIDFQEELQSKEIISKYTQIASIDNFLDLIFEQAEGQIVVFDEVQNIFPLSPDFFSVLQRKIDENKHKKIFLVFLGSLMGLMKRLFEDQKAPLFGRIQHKLLLKPLKYKDTREMLTYLGYTKEEDFISFYSVFGGYPKYYVCMEENELGSQEFHTVLSSLFFCNNAPLKQEVQELLMQEFGKKKGYYYELLEAIARGNTKLNDIATSVHKHQNEITSFMSDLLEYYEFIERVTRITDDPNKTRFSIYHIKNPLISFWFKFVYPNLNYLELGRFEIITETVRKEFNNFLGHRFEDIVIELAIDIFPKYTLWGKWWGNFREEGIRKEVEIDVIGLDIFTKEILFIECKWQENVNAASIFSLLKNKAKNMPWLYAERKEQYAIFAKSFKDKQKSCFDLKSISKKFS